MGPASLGFWGFLPLSGLSGPCGPQSVVVTGRGGHGLQLPLRSIFYLSQLTFDTVLSTDVCWTGVLLNISMMLTSATLRQSDFSPVWGTPEPRPCLFPDLSGKMGGKWALDAVPWPFCF